MNYINTDTLQVVDHQTLLATYPDTSFPPLDGGFVPPAPFAVVHPSPQPAFDSYTQHVVPAAPVQVDGQWFEGWDVVDIADTPEGMQAALMRKFDAALTAHLDATAQARRYDNRITCALRAGYVGPFQAEGQAFASWMDACNWQAYQVLAGVQSGDLTMPTIAEFIADLPEMVWPT